MPRARTSRKMPDMVRKRNPFAIEVGRRLRAVRLALDHKEMTTFAKRLNYKGPRYEKWEKGDTLLPVHAAMKIYGAFGVSSNWFYHGLHTGISSELTDKVLEEFAALQ